MNSSQSPITGGLAELALPFIRVALAKQLQAWNAIYEAEKILGFEITSNELQELAGGLDDPDSVQRVVTLEIVADWLAKIQFVAK